MGLNLPFGGSMPFDVFDKRHNGVLAFCDLFNLKAAHPDMMGSLPKVDIYQGETYLGYICEVRYGKRLCYYLFLRVPNGPTRYRDMTPDEAKSILPGALYLHLARNEHTGLVWDRDHYRVYFD